MGRIIGIDLGTTNSVVAVMEGGEPHRCPLVRRWSFDPICRRLKP